MPTPYYVRLILFTTLGYGCYTTKENTSMGKFSRVVLALVETASDSKL